MVALNSGQLDPSPGRRGIILRDLPAFGNLAASLLWSPAIQNTGQSDLEKLIIPVCTKPSREEGSPAAARAKTPFGTKLAATGDRKTGRQEDRKTGRQEDRKTGRQEDRKTGRQEDRKTGRQEDRKTGRQEDRKTGRQEDRKTGRQEDRKTGRQEDRKTGRQEDRKTGRQEDRKTGRQEDRKTGRQEDRKTGRQEDRKTGRQEDRKTGRQEDRKTGRQEDRKTGRQEDRKTGRQEDRKTGRQEDRKTGRQEDRKTGRQEDRKTGRQEDRKTGRQEDRKTGRQEDRKTGRQEDRKTGRQEDRKTGRQEDRKTGRGAWGEEPVEIGWAPGKPWVPVLRRPGKHAVVCFDGYLSKAFDQDDEGSCQHRVRPTMGAPMGTIGTNSYGAEQLCNILPYLCRWETFLGEERGDINEIWARARELLPPRISCLVDNVQLLQRSAEDARRDAKQWTASSGGEDHTGARVEEAGGGEADEETESAYQYSNVGNATRLIDVIRSAADANQITAGSPELTAMTQKLCRFQQSAISSTAAELAATATLERGERRINMPGRVFSGAVVPQQDQVKAIKSQQVCASKERVKMIQGIQNIAATHGTDRRAAARSVLTGFGDEDMQMTAADLEETVGDAEPSVEVRLGPSTTFLETGKELVARLTLNQKQAIAFLILCRQLDLIHCGGKEGDVGQLCQFVGGEGGTGKSRVIEALVDLFARKGLSNRLLITATSGTAAARINGITIHSACGFCKDQGAGANTAKDLDGARMAKRADRFVHGQSRMDWQEKEMLVIDEVSMLGARTLHAVNEQLCRLRGSQRDFGGIPIVLFCGDFHQFRPVQERSILLPSAAVSWDVDNSFKAEQRHQHDKAHALWKKFTTVVMLDEQMRAAGDPELQRLLKRIRLGVQDRTDLDLLNSRCYRESRRIPWESGITVVTPLNRNRWNLNMEASLAFQIQQRSVMRIFISEHKWKGGQPTEEEAIMMLKQGDDSAISVPAVFMFVAGMAVVVNHNTHQGLKLVNGAGYRAVEVILDKAYPGHQVSADTTIHFGPPAGVILESETTEEFHFVGMPPPEGTVLLTPMSVQIQSQQKRPWQQNDVTRKGLPCTAAFACTDYKAALIICQSNQLWGQS
ncbi:hypothetical protein HIM_11320 [Hirsutella minnesotensis 3608]|uniref:ATP-dependent DNA helicase n=1 Tax=Hirsutella minnesotensis 3608 TaxID=1043627 RepID=A0A0F8A1C5_9HYPO|nr:hypothetical protein HIM_11320 [Hirsutella minnesotensis 3608]